MRLTLLKHLLFAAAGAALVLPAAAQTSWPARPVKVIVPYATGGPADIYARFIAQRLGDSLGQPFVVDNKPGAGAVIGTDLAAKAPADGYTLLLMSNTHTVNETLVPNKPYQLTRDFVGVAPINASDLVLVAHPSVPASNVQQLLKLAKDQPGKLNYASSGTGTPYHMAGELFKSMSGTAIVHVPYKGSSGARTDVIGGQVQLMFDAVTTMTEQVKGGKVKAIATTGRKRSTVLPDVPTVDESGVPGYEATIWLGVLAPKGTPADVVAKLNAAISKITSSPDVQQEWARQGATAMVMSPTAFDKYIQDDIAKWAKVIQGANIKAE
ncbi:tripartite tricarboxylate transporter substrate binding protein [Ramlibacter algicola]|uniref:Tripartite tricarboxylate transporter substrate binding protein n=1 Tax=Ramlibacter algicola TaxID=2795217 RepID=A0A934PZR1_9BURK|nr:tripartite tricarboxylate transporter substrate binding protein [Ramlibacter algicola]MBK0391662.1 tripartite tricarboxylate transporter substrate binding protein [Ramlibacter algicola]